MMKTLMMVERAQLVYNGRHTELWSQNTPVLTWLLLACDLGQTHFTTTNLPFCIYKMGIILLTPCVILRV